MKKLVAYGTIQEMNLIVIGFLLASPLAIQSTSLFVLAHTVLSTIFFLIMDSLYKRFGTRSSVAIRGLIHYAPNLSYIMFTACILFGGLPFSLKFVVEVFIFTQLFNISALFTVLSILVCNWVGLVSFMFHWFSTLFGTTTIFVKSDVSIREGLVFSTLMFLLFVLSFCSFHVL